MDLEKAKQILHEWARKNESVRKLYIYGSRVNATFTKCSDLDIALEVEKQKGASDEYTTFMCNAARWEQELRSLLGWPIDIKWYNKDDKESVTRESVDNSGVLVYPKT